MHLLCIEYLPQTFTSADQIENYDSDDSVAYGKKFTAIITGAIIGDGVRKSRVSRASMIWDNFSIFRTNCAILTSYIRADSRTCQGLSRGYCYVA